MADMARVLVTYHYGGIYADLDFYCHRPYRCLLRKAMSLLREGRYDSKLALPPAISSNDSIPRDVLVVSREPLVHAVLFRNKSRVVIQDFFMATPRHPFFLWLLEDKLKLFNDSTAAAPAGVFPKGPFSYSIEKDIDRYLEQKRAADDSQKVVASGRKKRKASHGSPEQQPIDALATAPQQGRRRRVRAKKASRLSRINSSNSSRRQSVMVEDVIIELQEDVMHPLVDATNPRLYSTCAATVPGTVLLEEDDMRRSTCRIVDQRLFFRPSNETVLVHMWTHVFLGGCMYVCPVDAHIACLLLSPACLHHRVEHVARDSKCTDLQLSRAISPSIPAMCRRVEEHLPPCQRTTQHTTVYQLVVQTTSSSRTPIAAAPY